MIAIDNVLAKKGGGGVFVGIEREKGKRMIEIHWTIIGTHKVTNHCA